MKNKTFKIVILSGVVGLSSCIEHEQKVYEWRRVAVESRSAIVVPYTNFSSETEVHLRFSDGTSWEGRPSDVKPNERFLLHIQVGDTIRRRYVSYRFRQKPR